MSTQPQQMWTVKSILDWTQNYFTEKQIPTPRLDAELLLAHVCQYSRMELYLNYDKPLLEIERQSFRELIKQRVQGAPVAYLLKEKGFWTLTLHVEDGVLIPRPDTETLVETAITAIKEWQFDHEDTPCRILEVGTGTGAIPLALCSALKNLEITTTDISPQAIQTATRNITDHQKLLEPRDNSIELLEGDRMEMLSSEELFDFIISNPPYIPTNQIPHLQKEVAIFEPRIALDGGADGLDFYRYLFEKSAAFLKSEGQMLLEMGFDQGPALHSLLPSYLEFLQIIEDLQSNPRVFHVQKG